ncbi:DUF805 domain-containing protein [Novosphingobium sp. PhB165]|uniref:DUF805 domain-containing protein n=1 Tax=Novosphingobium sp. PhB165 TaxID=2485105 RepID=UPI001404531F|nr:DUF805 domain-containing protein [Novosphingobium sp. PhB165]
MKTWLRYGTRALRLTFSAAGRASRAEVLACGVSLILLNLLLSGTASLFLSGDALKWARLGIPALIVLPCFALFVRRAHDLNFSGLWTLPIPILALQNLSLDLVTLSAGWDARGSVEAVTRYLDWLLFPAFALVCLALVCIPGTRGTNRFGPDPRAITPPASGPETA